MSQKETETNHVESSSLHSPLKLQAIVDIIPVAIAEIDCQGRFLSTNHAYSRIFGYSVTELRTMKVQDLAAHPEEGRQLADLLARLAQEQPPPYRWEGRNRSKSGQLLEVVVDWDYIRNPDGRITGFMTAITDVTTQKKYETALAAKEQRYQAMFHNINSAVAVYEPTTAGDDFIVVDFNKTAAQTENISRDSVIGRKVTEVFPGVRALGLLEVLQKVNRTGRPEHLPSALYQDNRLTGWRENYVYKLPTGEIVAAYNDATERMRSLQALHESEERYRAIFKNAPLGIFRSTFDGRFLEVNPALAAMLGYDSPEEVLSHIHNIGEQVYLRPADRQDILASQKMDTNTQHHLNTYRRRDGTEFTANLYLKTIYSPDQEPLYLEGIVEDITARMRMQEELRQSESRFRSLVEYSTDHIFMLDRQGRYLFSNDRLRPFNAAKGATLIGKTLEDIYPADLAARYRRLIDHVFKTGIATSFEHDLEEPDGPHSHMNTLYPIYKEGAIWAIGGLCRDITRLKQYDTEIQNKTIALEKAFYQLRQTQRGYIDQEKHRALSQMASGISHDFNNSLSSILGFSDLLLQVPEKTRSPETVQRYIKMINNAAREAAQIVRRLRKFYRTTDDEVFEPVDLNSLIEEAVALTEPVWKYKAQSRGIEISLIKEFNCQAVVNGNPSELHETLTNLIFNAVDAMPEGGELRFTTWREDDWLKLEVRDTGTGMSGEVRSQCLNPFYTTKGDAGSGLGLSIIQGIVTRHQGGIEVESWPGRGTAFSMRLPLAIPADKTQIRKEKASAHGSSLKILVVEDEEHQRQLLTEYLKKDKHQVTTAQNGIEGTQKFYNGWYDLIITDRAMPELNGDGLARNIKAIAPDKPIIMLTGFGDMMKASAEKPAHVDLVISKPVTLARLRQAMRTVLIGGHEK